MRLINRLFFIAIASLIFTLGSSSVSFAANLDATVSKSKVAQGEIFLFKIVLDQSTSRDAINFDVLKENFNLGPINFGSTINRLNGVNIIRSEWNISLSAKKAGILMIPSFEVNSIQSKAIAIQVSKSTDTPKVDDLVEFNTHLDKLELYPNESTYLSGRLIIKTDVRQLQNHEIKPASAESGIDIVLAGDAKQYKTRLNGVEVTVVDFKFKITAKDAGRFTIRGPQFIAKLMYRINPNQAPRLIPINIPAKIFDVTVLEKPADYQGPWLPSAQLTFDQVWRDNDGKELTSPSFDIIVGDSLTRELILTVDNIAQEQLPNLVISNPSSVREYAEKPQFTILPDGKVQMVLKQVLIPKEEGTITLPEINLNWWNTQTKSKQTATAPSLILNVSQGEILNQSIPMPTDAKVFIEKNAGYWPYATAFFATLWLITLSLVVWMKRKRLTITASDSSLSSRMNQEYQQVKEVLQQQDGIRLNYALQQWKQSLQLTREEEAELEKTTMAFHQSLYATDEPKWDTKALEQLIDRLHKKIRISEESTNLAPL